MWLPIETAPRDGTEVLLWADHSHYMFKRYHHVVGHYNHGWWMAAPGRECLEATHWMPLPDPPQTANDEA